MQSEETTTGNEPILDGQDGTGREQVCVFVLITVCDVYNTMLPARDCLSFKKIQYIHVR